MRVDSHGTMTSTQIERSPSLNAGASNRRGKLNAPPNDLCSFLRSLPLKFSFLSRQCALATSLVFVSIDVPSPSQHLHLGAFRSNISIGPSIDSSSQPCRQK